MKANAKSRSVVIDTLLREFETGKNPRPQYFYCSRSPNEPGRSDPPTILASIARQMACLKDGGPLLNGLPGFEEFDGGYS